MLPEGWYHVAGDATGTRRYWDGTEFVGLPQRNAELNRRAGFVRPDNSSRWRLAGVLTRAVALLIDYGAPVVIIIGIAGSFGVANPGTDLEMWRTSTDLIIAIGAGLLFNQVVLVGLTGRSLGRILMGTRVVDARDRERSPGIVRALIRFVVLWPGIVVSGAMVLLGKRRVLHDLAAGTSVIYV